MSSQETKNALMDATVRLTATQGMKALTARGIAGEAGVNQALVYYHFEGVPGLVRTAYDRATRAMIGNYVAGLEQCTSFAELHQVGVLIADGARLDGSAALLSQVIASAHVEPETGELLTNSMTLWHDSVAAALGRVLDRHGLRDQVDLPRTTDTLVAATVGMITLGGLPQQPFGDPVRNVGNLAGLLDTALKLVPAPITRRILKALD